MLNKNEIKKSIIVSTAVLCAGTMLAMSPAQTVSAAVANPVSIATVVEQAPSAAVEVPVQWSTAEVYKDARYGETWNGATNYGSYVRWEWLNDMSYVFEAENAFTKDETALSYQYLRPTDMNGGDAFDSYVSHTDDNEPIRKYFSVRQAGTVDPGDTLWTYMDKMLTNAVVAANATAIGDTWMDTQEDAEHARLTVNITRINPAYNTIEKGYGCYVWQKATGKIFYSQYFENELFFDNNRALTVVYSFLPINQQ